MTLFLLKMRYDLVETSSAMRYGFDHLNDEIHVYRYIVKYLQATTLICWSESDGIFMSAISETNWTSFQT